MELDASLQIDRVGRKLPTGSVQLFDRETDRLHRVQEFSPGDFSSVLLLSGRRYMEHSRKDLESSFVNLDLLHLGLILIIGACCRISACFLHWRGRVTVWSRLGFGLLWSDAS